MSEHLAWDIGELVVVVLVAVLAAFALLSLRRWLLERRGGTVECSLRDPHGRGVWRLGIGRYNGDELLWFAIFGIRLRPRRVVHRRGLVVSGRRKPEAEEEAALQPDAGIVELQDGNGTVVELAMGGAALTGFLAWLEAAPPGSPIT
ncbi:DUF2550 domain-containing protein [Actinoallomurus sp. NPDC050550]|uniref:DUF2550 domain-containing protein n=1 Tax=Actinoallomurus sp. NPDC050550 TaxID=3154937 RepID=UPI0033E560C2